MNRKEYQKEWRLKNRQHCNKTTNKWRKNNPEKVREMTRKYRKNNSEKIKEYRKKNKEYQKEWRKNNLERRRKLAREWQKEQRKNPKKRLNANITTAIYLSLKGKKSGRHWETLVGYPLQDLICHLEKKFDDKMNWKNYGKYWHIDHIVPISWFPYQTMEDEAFRNCWALANLQPLEAKENLIKNNHFIS